MTKEEIERIKQGIISILAKSPGNQIVKDLEASVLTVEQLQAKARELELQVSEVNSIIDAWNRGGNADSAMTAIYDLFKLGKIEKRKHDVAACEDSGCLLMCKCSCHQGQGVRF